MTILMNIHPQYITNDNGEKVSVVISMKECEEMLEDIAIIAERM